MNPIFNYIIFSTKIINCLFGKSHDTPSLSKEPSGRKENEIFLISKIKPDYSLARRGKTIHIVDTDVTFFLESNYNNLPPQIFQNDDGTDIINMAGKFMCLNEDQIIPRACSPKEKNSDLFHLRFIEKDEAILESKYGKCICVISGESYFWKGLLYLKVVTCNENSANQRFIIKHVTSEGKDGKIAFLEE